MARTRRSAPLAATPPESREDVSVFVRIEVRHPETGGLNLPDLRDHLGNQLIAVEAAQHGARGKGRKAGIEMVCSAERIARRYRPHPAAAPAFRRPAQRGIPRRDSASSAPPSRHLRRRVRWPSTLSMTRLRGCGPPRCPDLLRGQTKVIGVDDQPAHAESVAAARVSFAFFGFNPRLESNPADEKIQTCIGLSRSRVV